MSKQDKAWEALPSEEDLKSMASAAEDFDDDEDQPDVEKEDKGVNEEEEEDEESEKQAPKKKGIPKGVLIGGLAAGVCAVGGLLFFLFFPMGSSMPTGPTVKPGQLPPHLASSGVAQQKPILPSSPEESLLVPASPEPVSPEPVSPEPALPGPTLPGPTSPEPSIPEPVTSEPVVPDSTPELSPEREDGKEPVIPDEGEEEAGSARVRQGEFEEELAAAVSAMSRLREDIEEAGARLRGEGMVTIGESELVAILAQSRDQQAKIASLEKQLEDTSKALSDKKGFEESALKRLAEAEKRYQEMEKKAEAAEKKLEEKEKQLAETKKQKPAPAPERKPSQQASRSSLGKIELQGIGPNFAVVKTPSGFHMWEVGQTLEGVKLLGLNASRQTVRTSAGNLTLKKAR